MQTSDEHLRDLKMIQSMYEYLSLSLEQAEEMYVHEVNSRHEGNHFLTTWEEWDYEESVFRQILSDEQFRVYKSHIEKVIKRYNDGLIKSDREDITTVEYNKELGDYYEQKFLPEAFNDKCYLHTRHIREIQTKVDFLKAEYKRFLSESRRERIVYHFRYNRTFSPNKLYGTLLELKLLYLLPDVFSFKGRMDEATKAVIPFLSSRLYLITDNIYASWESKLLELSRFRESIHKKHYPEPVGWAVFGQMTPDEEKMETILSLLLLDKDKYGWNPSLLK